MNEGGNEMLDYEDLGEKMGESWARSDRFKKKVGDMASLLDDQIGEYIHNTCEEVFVTRLCNYSKDEITDFRFNFYHAVRDKMFEKIIPIAEDLNVKVTPELHSPIPLQTNTSFVGGILNLAVTQIGDSLKRDPYFFIIAFGSIAITAGFFVVLHFLLVLRNLGPIFEFLKAWRSGR
jgi:hypothetical protein